jgi:hypothetical protein
MSDFGDPTKVAALLSLLAPGFIILWFRTRVVEGATPDFKQQLFYFAVVSAAYYGAVAPIFHVEGGLGLSKWAWSLLFYFLVPVALGLCVGWITQFDWEYRAAEVIRMHFAHRTPTAWDFRFSRLPPGTYLLVTLKDGSTVAGRMVGGSFAASAKDGRDLYIGEVWTVPAAGPWRKLEPARGLLICGDDIRYIEFFGGHDE